VVSRQDSHRPARNAEQICENVDHFRIRRALDRWRLKAEKQGSVADAGMPGAACPGDDPYINDHAIAGSSNHQRRPGGYNIHAMKKLLPHHPMPKVLSILAWVGIAVLGAAGFGVMALSRGETISAAWLVIAGVCTYLVAYRFYSRYLAYTVFGLDDRRATPAER
jgi:hypothetical protein